MGKKQNNKQNQRRLEDKVQSSCSVISSQSFIQGDIKSQDDLLVSGHLEGDVECSGMVRISQEGRIQGNIISRFLIIEGRVNGNIKEAEQIEIRKKGQLYGNIFAKRLAMAEESVFQGQISMTEKGGEPTHFVEKRE